MNNSLSDNKISYLSKECFDCLKGYFALCVLTHHAYLFTLFLLGTRFEIILYNLGYWAVSIFIFITGYGLYESYSTKGNDYINTMPFKRILSSVFFYFIVAIIYIIYDLIIGYQHELRDYIGTFTYGCTIISFGWYFQLSILLYLIFFFIFKFVKIKELRSLFIVLFVLAYFVFYYVNNMSVTLYVPIFSFIYGILCSKYKSIVEKILSKLYILIIFLSLFGFAFGSLFVWRYQKISPRLLIVLVSVLSQFFFVVFVISISRFFIKYLKWILINPISKFYGSVSMELYLFQGITIRILSVLPLNKYVYIALIFVCCTLVAIPFNKLFGVLQKKIFSK